jgi:hypothetical protein
MGFSKRKRVFIFFVFNLLFVTKYGQADSHKKDTVTIVTSDQSQYLPAFGKTPAPFNESEITNIELDSGFTNYNKINFTPGNQNNIRICRQPDGFLLFYLPLISDLPPPPL